MSGITWERIFASEAGPYAEVQWEKRDALIKYADGKVVFCQKDVLVPSTWSQLATNVVAQKYLRGFLDKEGNPGPNRETSVRQLIDRVVDTIAGWAGYIIGPDDALPEGWTTETSHTENGVVTTVAHRRPKKTMQAKNEVYFANKKSWEAWRDDLKWLCVHQRFAFNSPVWFNVGLDEHPQCSACFIVKMEDHMSGEQDEEFNLDSHGLLAAQVKEGIIFSKGSGSGINLSRVRSSKEWLSSGGRPTGPLSFARGLDTWASQIKSGGKTRRAAKMLILDVDHPDVLDFIRVKSEEEKVAKTLIANGYPGNMDGEAYQHAFHQNSNLSVRLSDEFMTAVSENKDWHLISRSFHNLDAHETATSMMGRMGAVLETHKATDIMRHIAQSCWESGDPGLHFSGQINHWHTCADEEPIVASNPCSEYLFLDETACNLASLNLRRFLSEDPQSPFKAREFIAAVRIATIAMEAIVSNSRYPTANFARMSHRYRTIGLGYANLGGMLMDLGIPYDSDFGRNIAAVITSLMCSQSYLMSAQIANELGAFGGYEANKQSVLKVMKQHHEASERLAHVDFPKGACWDLWADEATRGWGSVVTACRAGRGLRNAQATVLAPTGTIAFLMDCETTGIEPELGLVKYKVLSGGGTLQIINPLVEMFLARAGLSDEKVRAVAKHLMDGKSIRTADAISELPHPELLSEIFRTSFPPATEDKNFSLSWKAHIEMMAAVQPFISGAISKTVNMPESSTVEDVTEAFTYAWKAGLKCVAIYRDNSKAVQAVATTQKDDGSSKGETKVVERVVVKTIEKRSLPPTVPTTRHKFSIDGHKGYLHVGYYPDTWKVAEIFVKLSKTGSTLNGFVDAACKLWSTALQYGAPLSEIAGGFLEHEFEPRGFVEYDPHVRSCRSVLDYIAKKVLALESEAVAIRGLPVHASQPATDASYSHVPAEPEFVDHTDQEPIKVGLTCRNCGRANVAVKGKCKVCLTCGSEEGGCYA